MIGVTPAILSEFPDNARPVVVQPIPAVCFMRKPDQLATTIDSATGE